VTEIPLSSRVYACLGQSAETAESSDISELRGLPSPPTPPSCWFPPRKT